MHTHAYYTIRQVAEMASCSKIVIQKRLERGKLASFRQGKFGKTRTGRHIILAADAERFVAEYKSRRVS